MPFLFGVEVCFKQQLVIKNIILTESTIKEVYQISGFPTRLTYPRYNSDGWQGSIA